MMQCSEHECLRSCKNFGQMLAFRVDFAILGVPNRGRGPKD